MTILMSLNVLDRTSHVMLPPEAVEALSEQTAKFPMRFAKAAIIGKRPSPESPTMVSSGTATLVRLSIGTVAITCEHVVREALAMLAADLDTLFQIGDVVVDLNQQLIAINQERDIATIRIADSQLEKLLGGDEIGTSLFVPVAWPPPRPTEQDYVAFGGFPGTLREVTSFQDLVFGSWSSGSSKVNSSNERQFATHFQRDRWEQAYGATEHRTLAELGGMSGGPVFILRDLHWDLVGIVKEYHEAYDLMFFASLACVRSDGTIDDTI